MDLTTQEAVLFYEEIDHGFDSARGERHA
jgi:hypothetical protein